MEAIVFAAADAEQIDRSLARALLTQESGGDPSAVSSAGAVGLMQIMPATAAGIAQEIGVASYDMRDPATNARFGMHYLRQKLDRYGNLPWALAALNASEGALRDVTIAPGATWSFNAAVGNPAGVEIRTVGGVPGGGWCDLASRYVQALRPLLPTDAFRFARHHVFLSGIALYDVANDDAVSIWNIGGQAGSGGGAQDLEIFNTLDRPLRLQVASVADGTSVVVRAHLE